MQKRLFTLFLLLSILPSLVILLVNWQTSERHLGFLDSPGLSNSLESSLRLARRELSGEQSKTEQELATIEQQYSIQGILPEPSAEATLVLFNSGPDPTVRGVNSTELLERLTATGERPAQVDRVIVDDQQWLVAYTKIKEGQLVLARPLDRELAADLADISQGSTRLRQMRLYYGDLLRGDTLLTLTLLALILLVVALVLSRQLARRIAGPVRALAEGTRRIADGDLNHQVTVKAPDELGQLVDAFNLMTEDLRNSKADLVRAERIAAWQGIARRLAHEIKNPLTPISLAMHQIGKREADPAVTEAVEIVLEEVESLTRLADEFSQYARLPVPVPETVGLQDMVRSVVELYTQETRLDVVWENWHNEVWVNVDPALIRQALANLVKNAVAMQGSQGQLKLILETTSTTVLVHIADSGPGLPEPVEKVFEPYYTTRETGTGLGLPIARKTVEDAGGSLGAENRPSGGAMFTVILPRVINQAS